MFNLKQHDKPVELLESELEIFNICRNVDGFNLKLGDESIQTTSLDECSKLIKEGILELKEHLWSLWQQLEHISVLITNNDSENHESVDNILFLNNVKKNYLLSRNFDDLKSVSDSLKGLFNTDISSVNNNLIVQFNQLALDIKLVHKLIMTERYRLKLIKRCRNMNKLAQISGPWANLDLPMKERVWEWAEDEEYMEQREQSRKEQTRYNPENTAEGYFFVWQDLNRSPYRFEDMGKDSPYKSRLLLTQA